MGRITAFVATAVLLPHNRWGHDRGCNPSLQTRRLNYVVFGKAGWATFIAFRDMASNWWYFLSSSEGGCCGFALTVTYGGKEVVPCVLLLRTELRAAYCELFEQRAICSQFHG